MSTYSKPCGCWINMESLPTQPGEPEEKRWLMRICPKHEVVPVLREKGDTGLLGPKKGVFKGEQSN